MKNKNLENLHTISYGELEQFCVSNTMVPVSQKEPFILKQVFKYNDENETADDDDYAIVFQGIKNKLEAMLYYKWNPKVLVTHAEPAI